MTRLPAVACAAAVIGLAACGSAVEHVAPWAADHPAPSGMSFKDATDFCALVVQFPNDAPGEIDYQGKQFIQRGQAGAATATGSVVGRSGDWTIHRQNDSTLILVASAHGYLYRAAADCSKQPPPS